MKARKSDVWILGLGGPDADAYLEQHLAGAAKLLSVHVCAQFWRSTCDGRLITASGDG